MGPMKIAVVGADYFARRGRATPDISPSQLVQYRRAPTAMYCVLFERTKCGDFVDGRVMVKRSDLAFAPQLRVGIATVSKLCRAVLRSASWSATEDWSPSFEGLFLYYPGHRRSRPRSRPHHMIRTAAARTPAFTAEPFTRLSRRHQLLRFASDDLALLKLEVTDMCRNRSNPSRPIGPTACTIIERWMQPSLDDAFRIGCCR